MYNRYEFEYLTFWANYYKILAVMKKGPLRKKLLMESFEFTLMNQCLFAEFKVDVQ